MRRFLLVFAVAAVLITACSGDAEPAVDPAEPDSESSTNQAATASSPQAEPDPTPTAARQQTGSPPPLSQREPLGWTLPGPVTLHAGPALDWAERGVVDGGAHVTLLGASPSASATAGIVSVHERWVQIDAGALSGWAAAESAGLSGTDVARLPRVLPDAVTVAAHADAPYFLAPSDEQEPGHRLAGGESLHVMGRSADMAWLAVATVSYDACPECPAYGWMRAADVELAFDFPVAELPILADIGTVVLFHAGHFAGLVQGSAPVSSLANVRGRWGWLPAPPAPGQQPALIYAAHDGLRRFGFAGAPTILAPVDVYDFVIAPTGDALVASGPGGVTSTGLVIGALTHVSLDGTASPAGEWVPGCCHGIFLAARSVWSPDGAVFAFTDLRRDDAGEPMGTELQVITEGAPETTIGPGPERTRGTGAAPAWGGDGRLYVVADGELRRFTADGTPAPLASPPPAQAFALSPAGGLIAIQTPAETVRVVDTEGVPIADLGPGNLFGGFPWSADGRFLGLTGDGSALRIWDSDSGTVATYTDIRSRYLRWSPSDSTLALYEPGPTRLLDATSGEVLELPEHAHFIGPRWSPDGRFVALFLPTRVVLAHGRLIDGLNGLAQGQWRVYTRDGELRMVVRTRFCGSDAAWSPDGQWFAVGDQLVDCT